MLEGDTKDGVKGKNWRDIMEEDMLALGGRLDRGGMKDSEKNCNSEIVLS